MMKKITFFIFLLTISLGYSQELLNLPFDTAASVNDWTAVADATNGAEASKTFIASGGNPDGAMQLSGINSADGIGRAYIFEYLVDPTFDYMGETSLNVSFDLKIDTDLVGTNLQFQSQVPKIGGGVVSINHDNVQSGLTLGVWTTKTFLITDANFDNTGGFFKIFFNIAAGAFVGAGGTIFIDNVVVSPAVPPATQEITVKVDVSEQAPVAGVNIAWWNGAGFDEYAAVDDGGGVWSYKLTSSAPANLSTGVLRTYKWKIYYSGGGDAFENMQLLPGGGGLEHDIFKDVPANEPINTDFANYLDRGVMPDGTDWTAKTYYFDSFRQPGVSYTDLNVTAESSGKNIVMDYNVNGWDPFHGPGTVDNGDNTYTAKVRSSVGFQYLWNDLSSLGQEDLLTCTNDGITIDTDNSTYANRIHAAGVAEIDIFNTCPNTAGLDDLNSTSFSAYPNPTKDSWTVKTKNINMSSVKVYDILGKNVLSLSPNASEVRIDGSGLRSGLYFVKISTASGTSNIKLLKN